MLGEKVAIYVIQLGEGWRGRYVRVADVLTGYLWIVFTCRHGGHVGVPT